AWFGAVRASEALALLSPELRSAVPPEGPSRHARHLERVLGDMQILRRGEVAPLVAYQLLDFETYLPGDLLTKVDRCTMALGVDPPSPARVKSAGVLDTVAVQHLLREHLDGREDRGRALWTVLSLQCWAERWPVAASVPVAESVAPAGLPLSSN